MGSVGNGIRLPSNFDITRYGGVMNNYEDKQLLSMGYTEDEIRRVRSLFDIHSGNNRQQQTEADAEIAAHIEAMDRIGQLLYDKSQIELAAIDFDRNLSYQKAMQSYQSELEYAQNQLKPGGMYANYTKEQLMDWGEWPELPELQEPRFYRKGTMDRNVLAFSTNPKGASWGSMNDEDSYIGYDHTHTIAEMLAMGYRPIGGAARMDVGQPGDSEVLFAKFEKRKGRKS